MLTYNEIIAAHPVDINTDSTKPIEAQALTEFDDGKANAERCYRHLLKLPEGYQGNYNNTFYQLAATCRDYAISPGYAVEMLVATNATWQQPSRIPDLRDELTRVVQSAYRNAVNTPGARHPIAQFTRVEPESFAQKAIEDAQNPDLIGMNPHDSFMEVEDQKEHFKGCVYVVRLNRVLTPGGDLLTQEQFRAVYGGYNFALDALGKKHTDNAFRAFTENRAFKFPKAADTCFEPQQPFGVIITDEDDKRCVNVYKPLPVPCQHGDVTPFIEHMTKLLPDGDDRALVMAYMAAVVQYPGVKFQWWPVIQGTEGNGKTFLAHVLARAVGNKYSHCPSAQDLSNKFNSWIQNKIFVFVEEIRIKDRIDVLEALKPLVTNTLIEVQAKGVDQTMVKQCANGMMFSNYPDAVRQGHDTRRYATFMTAQQSYVDLIASGMGGEYFPHLYDWAKGGGFAYITHYLKHYDIPDHLNPASMLHRAPRTSTTDTVIAAGMGGIEQIIQDAVDSDRPGFMYDLLTTQWCTQLLKEHNIKTYPRTLGVALNNLGYIKHPALDDKARVSVGNQRLFVYVKRDSRSAELENKKEITKLLRESFPSAFFG